MYGCLGVQKLTIITESKDVGVIGFISELEIWASRYVSPKKMPTAYHADPISNQGEERKFFNYRSQVE